MPVKKQDAHRALELLEVYHDQLNSPSDIKLRNAIEDVIRTFKGCLFKALLDIQEFYESTLMNEDKSNEEKMIETLLIATKLEMNSEALAFPIAYEISSASRLANYQSTRSLHTNLNLPQSSIETQPSPTLESPTLHRGTSPFVHNGTPLFRNEVRSHSFRDPSPHYTDQILYVDRHQEKQMFYDDKIEYEKKLHGYEDRINQQQVIDNFKINQRLDETKILQSHRGLDDHKRDGRFSDFKLNQPHGFDNKINQQQIFEDAKQNRNDFNNAKTSQQRIFNDIKRSQQHGFEDSNFDDTNVYLKKNARSVDGVKSDMGSNVDTRPKSVADIRIDDPVLNIHKIDDLRIDPPINPHVQITSSTSVKSNLHNLENNVEWILETIVLERGSKGFGFSISGGVDNPHVVGDPSIFVTSIIDNHSAAYDGRFRLNDIILSVNECQLNGVSHAAAVEILKKAGNKVTFVVKRQKSGEQSIRLDLVKGTKGLGFSIGGGVGNQHLIGDNGIFVTDIVAGGAAHGLLMHLDRIIYVNGFNLENVTHDKAVHVLKSVLESAQMIIGRSSKIHPNKKILNAESGMHQTSTFDFSVHSCDLSPSIQYLHKDKDITMNFDLDSTPSYEPAFSETPPLVMVDHSIPRGPRRLMLRKGNTGLGFNIVGGEDGEGLFISHIMPGGEADTSGELFRGDQILSVNDIDLQRAKHALAASILKSVDDAVELVVVYNPEEYNRFESKIYELRQQLLQDTPCNTLSTTKKRTLFVRVLFDYDPFKDEDLPARGLSFSYGDVLHVTNASDEEWWQARKIVPMCEEATGLIPSRSRIERKERMRLKNVKFNNKDASGKTPTSLSLERKKKSVFHRKLSLSRSRERSKSLEGLNQDMSQLMIDEQIHTYEVVIKQELHFVRPLIILGPLKELITSDLIQEYPEYFATCLPHTSRPRRPHEVDGREYHFVASRQQMEEDIENGLYIEAGQYNGNLYGTSLASILDVANQNKHCILDVTVNAIERLHLTGLYPITILMKPNSIDTLSRWLDTNVTDAEVRQIYDATLVAEQNFAEYITAIVIGWQIDEVYLSVKEVIWNQSGSYIWVPVDTNTINLDTHSANYE